MTPAFAAPAGGHGGQSSAHCGCAESRSRKGGEGMERRTSIGAVIVGLVGLASASAFAQNGPGITDKEILICSYQPMTGNT